MRREHMCPDRSCEHYGKPTRLMGGCHCGTALVPFKTEPTDDQLEMVMIAMGVPAMVAHLTLRRHRDKALELHGLVQRAINGDREANRRLAAMRTFFAAALGAGS